MTVVWIALVAALVCLVVLLTLGRLGVPERPDRDDLVVDLPTGEAVGADLRTLRLPVAWRGYRMSEVDDLLDRLAAELDSRDERLRALEAGEPAEPQG